MEVSSCRHQALYKILNALSSMHGLTGCNWRGVLEWYQRPDSNRHAIAGKGFWIPHVYQFHHSGMFCFLLMQAGYSNDSIGEGK